MSDDLSINLSRQLSSIVGRPINRRAPVVVNVPPAGNPDDPPPVGDNPTWDPNATPIGGIIEPLSKLYKEIHTNVTSVAINARETIRSKSNIITVFIKKIIKQILKYFNKK